MRLIIILSYNNKANNNINESKIVITVIITITEAVGVEQGRGGSIWYNVIVTS